MTKKLAFALALALALEGFAEYDTQFIRHEEPKNFEKIRWLPKVGDYDFDVKRAGKYKFFYQYEQPTNRPASLQIRFRRKDNGETIRFAFHEYVSTYPGKIPAPMSRTGGKVWASLDVAFEFPGVYTVDICSAYGAYNPKNTRSWGERLRRPMFYGMYLTDDPKFDPENPSPVTDIAREEPKAGWGMKRATSHRYSMNLNSGIDPYKRLQLSHMECYPYYMDFSILFNYGINMNYGSVDIKKGYEEYDALATGHAGASREESWAFAKMYPAPIGRSANSRGEYSKSFSNSFEPYKEFCRTTTVESVKRTLASENNEGILNWFSAWEQCGDYDYGETSVKAYRKFLEKKYGSLAKLNQRWHTDYTSFDEINPSLFKHCLGKDALTNALERARAKANFIDFRDFNSKAYAEFLAIKTRAIQATDTKKRDMTSAYSNNNLGSIQWLRWRPLCFEDVMQNAMKGSTRMGWDIYATDDQTLCSFEHFYAMGDEKIWPMIKEGSTHGPDPRLAVRSLWQLFGEGMKGMSLFCIQESPKCELRKFGLSNPDDDMAPRPKLGAYTDVFRAVAHIENFLAEAKRKNVGKPVALYYSQTCNLMQERGYGSIFDSAPDTLWRVYEMIRANGYPCTIITDRQIQTPELLDKVSAIFFMDAQYIPEETTDALAKWIEKGGHIVADGQTGAYDGHGFPTRKFIDLLGIEPVVRKRVDESAAETIQFAYSSNAYEVINQDELWQTMNEYLHQRESDHPIVKAAGKVMFSGFGSQLVKSKDGEVIILENNGNVGWNIRQIGKGTASYAAFYLGTIYDAGSTQYEWRNDHSADSPYRWMDAYLQFFGAKKNGETDLEDKYKLRFTAPLIAPSGNMLVTITSYADYTLPEFRMRSFLPADVAVPKQLFLKRDGSREVTALDFIYNKEKHALEYTVPAGVNVFANVLMIQNEVEPIVSVTMPEAKRDAARLADLRPGEKLELKVKVFNPSDKKLKGGKVTVRLPDGWFVEDETIKVGTIGARDVSKEVTFTVQAPSVCAARRLKPINFIYENGETKSMPTVETVWFQTEPQNPKPLFN